jgi:CBS-domain-containing membrane protein
VAKNMSQQQVRRLPVVDREKRLVGIVSLGNIAQSEARAASKVVKGVTKPGGAHAT